jgi:hypothetical protein
MRTSFPRLLTLAVVLWLGATGFSDTVKLRDGTTLEGSITGENANSLTMDVEFAGGTIHQTRTVPKPEIAGIKRLSDAEKKQLQMEKDFQAALKFRLDPVRSFAVPQYDQIISNTFRRFLTEYPDSPHRDEMAARLRDWQAERDRVAGGEVKYAGEWRPAAEAGAWVEKDNGQQWLQSARQLIADNKLEQAIPYLRGVTGLTTQRQMVEEARALLTKTYEQLIGAVDKQISQIQPSIAAARQQVEKAQQAVAVAEAGTQNSAVTGLKNERLTKGYQALGGDSKAFSAALAKSNLARAQLTKAQTELAPLESQLAMAQQKSDQLRANARQAGIQLAAAVSSTQTAAVVVAQSEKPSGSEDLQDQMGGMLRWIKDHWLLFAGGAVVALWLVSRLMR